MRVCCTTATLSKPALLLAILSHTSASRRFFGARGFIRFRDSCASLNVTSHLCQSVALPLHTMGWGVGCPSAVRVAATGGVDWVLWKRERKMALRTKRHPFPVSSNPFPKLHIANKSNLFAKQFLERLQLLFCLLVINMLTFKLRLKAAFLRLQCCYLAFRLRKTVKRKRNALSENLRNRNVLKRVSGDFNHSHTGNIT